MCDFLCIELEKRKFMNEQRHFIHYSHPTYIRQYSIEREFGKKSLLDFLLRQSPLCGCQKIKRG